jgi:5-methylthioadenosine/S-adenosylhomocysteine deaminase
VQPIDLLLSAAHVVPMTGTTVLADHSVAIDRGRIVGVLPTAQARARFEPRRTVSLADHVLLPGLVNLHCHAAMSLLRGLADDTPLMTWLQEHVWPAEARHVSHDFVRDGSLLAMGEMLRGGVTCVNDMYFFPEATARAALEAGLRAAIGIIAIEFPSAYAANAQDYLDKGLATRKAYLGESLLSFTLAPHAPYTVADTTLKRIVALSDALDMPVHMHVHETAHETEQGEREHGMRPLERMNQLGLVGPRLIAVHAVHLTDGELDALARAGASIAHCPSSNLKLASGIARVADMLARGIRVGVGTDGAASNNRLDVFTEMRTAALLAKARSGDAAVVSAHQALRMATIDAAAAIGLQDEIGSLEPGKSADLIAVTLDSVETQPCFDAASHLVYAAGREHVTHAWIAGEPRLEDRRLLTLDSAELLGKARWWRGRIAG